MRIDKEHILRKVFGTDIPRKEVRTAENKIERCNIQWDLDKYWIERKRGDGQGDME